MKNQSTQSRVVFKIDEDLYSELKQFAKSSGSTKSKLLRKWLEESPELNRPVVKKKKKNFLFNFYMSDEEKRSLRSKSAELGISVSELIRRLIITNIAQSKSLRSKKNEKEISYTALADLRIKGRFKELQSSLSSDFDRLGDMELFYYAEACTELTRSIEAKRAINELKSRLNNQFGSKLYLHTLVLEGFERMIQNKLEDGIKLFELVNSIASYTSDGDLMGITYYLLGESNYRIDNFEKARSFYDKALKYLNIDNNPTQVARIFTRYAMLNLKQGLEYESYLDSAKKILGENSHQILMSWFYSTAASIYTLTGNERKLQKYISLSLSQSKASSSIYNLSYSFETKGKNAFRMDEFDDAYMYFSNAIDLDSRYKDDAYYSASKMYQIAIVARNDFKKAKGLYSIFEQKKEALIKDKLISYMKNSMYYIYGEADESAEGKKNLLKMMDGEYAYELMKQAITSTLKTKKICALT